MNAINYKDGSTLHKIMAIIKDLRLRYYIDAHGVVQTPWGGKWKPWHEVAKHDKRLEVKQ